MTLFDLTGFQRDLLYVIAGLDRPSGQQIKQELEAATGREITHGRLYPNLDTLVNRSYVDKGEIDRRTNYYELSGEGHEALTARQDWEDNYLPFESSASSAA
ncbi:PadR family transcriptional regulator [Halomarina pelagica]|uniref:PadR family transcriptional regulator n=1 Tax=Halomarina pelagica TaxID=2961599 RepID=UPI0020C23F4A|nr:PadR family transcriptional regulator [Halomarina sp. BND7]